MRVVVLLYFLISCVGAIPTFTQPPRLIIDFEKDTTLYTLTVIKGTANNPITQTDNSFWVK